MIQTLTTVDDYLQRYGPLLAARAQKTLDPLHWPARDPVHPAIGSLLRSPFAAQSHVITGAVQALQRQKSLFLVGEMGCGKTMQGMAIVQSHASGAGAKPPAYRAIVLCPGHIAEKWVREIKSTIPGARTKIIESWRDLLPIYAKRRERPTCPEWNVIARDRAKLGPRWRPAYTLRRGVVHCPACGNGQLDDDDDPIPEDWFAKAKRKCRPCGSSLWTCTGEIRRAEPARFIQRRLRGYYQYLILDEVHEMKAANTANGHAASSLAASVDKVIALTGTLLGGYAEHLRPLLFRLCPSSLIEEGLAWQAVTAFNERYGRLETIVKEREGGGSSNRQSRGGKSTTVLVRPGVMPSLFGRHLLGNAVFLSLAEVADQLPPLDERAEAVGFGSSLDRHYRLLELAWKSAIKERLMEKGPRSLQCLLGPMLSSLLLYPDHPFGWEKIGYTNPDTGKFVVVHEPTNLQSNRPLPKEERLIEIVRAKRRLWRQVWIYATYNGAMDVQGRIVRLLTEAGFKVGDLRASVPLAERERWIADHAPQCEVIVSHPKLVETGLDFFDGKRSYNFPSIVWYETGYNLFTLRQASRRAWRIGQPEPCDVTYLYYDDSMQSRAMALMGKKLAAAQAIDGKFSSEGLAALAEDESLELAIARSLADQIDVDAGREWAKIASPAGTGVASTLPPAVPSPAIRIEPSVRRPRPKATASHWLCADWLIPAG